MAATMECDQDACWICLATASEEEPLIQPCACPRPVHGACLARWQLHSAGTSEETACRFCAVALPDWKGVLTPAETELAGGMPYVAPTMSVTFNGEVHHVVVQGGPGGYESFIGDIRRIFCIGPDAEMALAFDCADPVTGALVKLNGAGAYQAAVHCAAVSAAKRLAGWSRQQRAAAAAAAAQAAEAAGGGAELPPTAAAPPASQEWPPLPTRAAAAGEPATTTTTAATAAAPCTPGTEANDSLALPRRVSERGTSQDSETGALGVAVGAALAEAAAGTASAPTGLAPQQRRRGTASDDAPAAPPRPNDDVRRALAHMTASLKRLHAAAAAAAAAADAAGRAANGVGGSGLSSSTTTAATLQRATAAAGVDPAALRSLQARVVGLLRAMPRPVAGAAVQARGGGGGGGVGGGGSGVAAGGVGPPSP